MTFGTKLDSSVLLFGSLLAGFPLSQCGEPWLQNSQNNSSTKVRCTGALCVNNSLQHAVQVMFAVQYLYEHFSRRSTRSEGPCNGMEAITLVLI